MGGNARLQHYIAQSKTHIQEEQREQQKCQNATSMNHDDVIRCQRQTPLWHEGTGEGATLVRPSGSSIGHGLMMYRTEFRVLRQSEQPF